MSDKPAVTGKRNERAFSVRKNGDKWDVISPDGVTVAHSGFATIEAAKQKAVERTANN